MKKFIKFLALTSLLSSLFGLTAISKQEVKAEAATVETKRVWMKNSITETWDYDGAATAIHYWGGSTSTAWPGVRALWDSENELVYYDIPADTPYFMFVRVSGGTGTPLDWGAKTDDLLYTDSIGKYYDLTGPIAWNGAITPGSWVSFTPKTTKVVKDFAATIDTAAKACSPSAVDSAISAYNNLSTFEQDQFDTLDVGGGVTGLQRLEYLKAFYNINTPLNVKLVNNASTKKNITAVILVSGLSLSVLAGYYFLRTKKQ